MKTQEHFIEIIIATDSYKGNIGAREATVSRIAAAMRFCFNAFDG